MIANERCNAHICHACICAHACVIDVGFAVCREYCELHEYGRTFDFDCPCVIDVIGHVSVSMYDFMSVLACMLVFVCVRNPIVGAIGAKPRE